MPLSLRRAAHAAAKSSSSEARTCAGVVEAGWTQEQDEAPPFRLLGETGVHRVTPETLSTFMHVSGLRLDGVHDLWAQLGLSLREHVLPAQELVVRLLGGRHRRLSLRCGAACWCAWTVCVAGPEAPVCVCVFSKSTCPGAYCPLAQWS